VAGPFLAVGWWGLRVSWKSGMFRAVRRVTVRLIPIEDRRA